METQKRQSYSYKTLSLVKMNKEAALKLCKKRRYSPAAASKQVDPIIILSKEADTKYQACLKRLFKFSISLLFGNYGRQIILKPGRWRHGQCTRFTDFKCDTSGVNYSRTASQRFLKEFLLVKYFLELNDSVVEIR